MTLPKAELERRKAARLASGQVERANKGRALAEGASGSKGPGRPKKDRPKTVEEAATRVKAEEKAATAPAGSGSSAATEWREPTKGEIAQVKFFMRMGNKPLLQLERDLEAMGMVGDKTPPALALKGEIPATEEELEMGAECTAGTLVGFTPNVLRYLAPIGLAMFTVSFVGTRLLIFWRMKRAMDEVEKREKLAAEEREAQRAAASRLAPTAAPSNGTRAELLAQAQASS